MFRILRAVLNTKCMVLALIISAQAPVAKAAATVFADPTSSCSGFSPCFTTIQEAINNAGPGFAEVGVFPGVYAESVDLSLMGSAIGEGPGSLLIQALSAAGGATDSGVLIDPGAIGGPGTGTGLSTGEMMPFEGNIFLNGLAMTSPDTAALGISMIGNLTIADLVVQNAASSGLVGVVEGDASLTRITASMNGANGLVMDIIGSATGNELTANQNTDDGILLGVSENLTVQNIEASQNETGAQFFVCQQADIGDLTASQNQFNGAVIIYGPDDCQPSTNATATGVWQPPNRVVSLEGDAAVFGGNAAGNLVAEMVLAENNGNVGIGILSSTGVAELDGLIANDNASSGMLIQSQQVELNDSAALGNQSGVLVIAEEALMTRVQAFESQTMSGTPPVDGTGIVVSAHRAVMDDLQADDNLVAGLALLENQAGFVPDYTLVNSQFDGNDIGVFAESSVLLDVVLDDISSTNNASVGLAMSDLATATLSNVSASGSDVGMDLFSNGNLLIETANVEFNGTGLRIQIERDDFAAVYCSNFIGNTEAGLELAQGSALPAGANFWDSATGPTHPGNPNGTGDQVVDFANGGTGDVNYSGFLSQPATDAECPELLIEAVPVPALSQYGIVLLLFGMLLVLWLSKRSASV